MRRHLNVIAWQFACTTCSSLEQVPRFPHIDDDTSFCSLPTFAERAAWFMYLGGEKYGGLCSFSGLGCKVSAL